MQNSVCVLILAAGAGKRMQSIYPKPLEPVCSLPMISHTLHAIQQADQTIPIGIVIGQKKEAFFEILQPNYPTVVFIEQKEPLGTLDALVSAYHAGFLTAFENVLILPADMPLIPPSLIQEAIKPLSSHSAVRVITTVQADPTGYGRIIRNSLGKIEKIIEHTEASAAEKKICEVATSIYLFNREFFAQHYSYVTNNNQKHEYYLTDLIEFAGRSNAAEDLIWPTATDLLGVNNFEQLEAAEAILVQRLAKALAQKGVNFSSFTHIYLEPEVSIALGCKIGRNVSLKGRCQIGLNVTIEDNVCLENVIIESHSHILTGTIAKNSYIGAYCQIGPYAHLRPESKLSDHVRIGNFVELKKVAIGHHTRIAHLSYLGDATVGNNVNIGCGFITCNYDGQQKHHTSIQDDVFIGSNCQAIAPIEIKKGAWVAAGTTLTNDVPEDSLAIARTQQVNKLGYAKKYNKPKNHIKK